MKCIRCEVEFEKTIAGECRLCESVSKVLCLIYGKWMPSEIEELARSLRGGTVLKMIEELEERGAYLLLQVCRLIRHLGHSLEQGSDYLKIRVCEALMKQVGHEESCRKWRVANGVSYEQSRAMLAGQIRKSMEEILAV